MELPWRILERADFHDELLSVGGLERACAHLVAQRRGTVLSNLAAVLVVTLSDMDA